MNLKDMTHLLNYRISEGDILKDIQKLARSEGIVIVYGYSDDLMEFRGAINDEVSAYDGGTAYLDAKGIIQNECDNEDCPYHQAILQNARVVKAIWHNQGNPCWTYETTIPHETFEIKEDDELYCIGIVFYLKDVDKA